MHCRSLRCPHSPLSFMIFSPASLSVLERVLIRLFVEETPERAPFCPASLPGAPFLTRPCLPVFHPASFPADHPPMSRRSGLRIHSYGQEVHKNGIHLPPFSVGPPPAATGFRLLVVCRGMTPSSAGLLLKKNPFDTPIPDVRFLWMGD